MNEERWTRYQARFNPTDLPPVVIAGTGAVGSCVARLLATMGAPHITLVDFDTIEAHNLGTQFFREADLHRPKVIALHGELNELNPGCNVQYHQARIQDVPLQANPHYRFACLDSMKPRWWLCNNWGTTLATIDTRMAGLSGEVYITSNPDDYRTCLFPEAEMFDQAACAVRSYPLTSMLVACRAVEGLIQHHLYGTGNRWPVHAVSPEAERDMALLGV